jgi:DNA-binding beta-propeller fold protein YncE
MDLRKRRLSRGGWIAAWAALIVGLGLGWPGTKLRVIYDNASIKATPGITGQNLTTVPLNTILEAETKQGEWYKVTVTKDIIPITGYIHEINVEEITEAEVQQTVSPAGRVKSQADIVAEIEFRMKEGKRLVLQENDPDKAMEDLRLLIAKSFSVDDRQRQRQIACEIYLWIGLAGIKKGDSYEALKEFRNMIDVDSDYSREITKNNSDPVVSGLLDHAEKLSKGLLTEYTIQIATTPKEALIRINGKPIGPSPVIHRSGTPKISVEIEKEGYKPIKDSVFLMQASSSKDYALQSLGRNLAVSTVPKGARIFVDGKESGKQTDCELPFLAYGSHTIKLARENHAVWEGPVQITEGDGPVSLAVTLAVNSYVFIQKNGGPESKFFKLPRAIAFDKEENFYIADESSAYRIKKFDRDGGFRASWGDAGRETKILNMPGGIAVDGAGNVYVTDTRECCVLKFDKNGKFLKKWGQEGAGTSELSGPTAIAVDSSGDIYVADTNNNRVVKYSPEGAVKRFWGRQGAMPGEFYRPTALTVDPKNEILVIDRSRLQRFGSEGEPLGSWGRPGNGEGEFRAPLGVCTDPLGNVYVADTGNNRLMKFDPNGKLISQWGQPGTNDGEFAVPVSIAVSGQNRILVVERTNQRYQEFRIPEK